MSKLPLPIRYLVLYNKEKQRLDWLLKDDPCGRNRRFIDKCIRDKFQKELDEFKSRRRKIHDPRSREDAW